LHGFLSLGGTDVRRLQGHQRRDQTFLEHLYIFFRLSLPEPSQQEVRSFLKYNVCARWIEQQLRHEYFLGHVQGRSIVPRRASTPRTLLKRGQEKGEEGVGHAAFRVASVHAGK
jgi:hypothetical protein